MSSGRRRAETSAKLFPASSLGTADGLSARTSVSSRSGISSATDTRYRLSMEIDLSPALDLTDELARQARAITQPPLAETALLAQGPHPLRHEFPHVVHRASAHGSGSLSRTGTRRERAVRSEEHTSELQSHLNLVCRLLLAKK